MRYLDTFLKALLHGPNPDPEYGYLSMDQCLRLLEDVDYETFSPKLKLFIQSEYKRLDAKQRLKSLDC